MTLLEAIRYYGSRVHGDPRIKIDEFDSQMLEWLTQLHKVYHIMEDAEDDIKASHEKIDAAIIRRDAYDDIRKVIIHD